MFSIGMTVRKVCDYFHDVMNSDERAFFEKEL